MTKKLLPFGIALLFVIGILYKMFFSATDGGPQSLAVRSDETISEIAAELKDQNLIRSEGMFLFLANTRHIVKIPSGRHQIPAGLNVSETLNSLAHPKQETVKITIPEGYDIADIDSKLFQLGFISEGEFSAATASMEGYLFPDTYFVYNFDFSVQDLVSKMKNNFLKKITPDITEAIQKEKRTLSDIIIMASILEKEVRTEKDYPIVAGILWKRLDIGWPLQTDATLLYGNLTAKITKADLEDANNPYNTRIHKGLTPTPIDNPGLRAIRAAAFPEKSPYWFYLTDKDGVVHYAVTNDEHNANRAKYLN